MRFYCHRFGCLSFAIITLSITVFITPLESLIVTQVSQASAEQRAGRAGRVRAGTVYQPPCNSCRHIDSRTQTVNLRTLSRSTGPLQHVSTPETCLTHNITDVKLNSTSVTRMHLLSSCEHGL